MGMTAYYIFFSHVFYCQTIRWSDFREADDRLYLSPGINASEEAYAKKVIRLARRRNAAFWGELEGNPVYIWCADAREYRKYCQSSEGAGCSLGTPFGETYIILNPSGANVDVVSHELCHSELFSRLGWWTTTWQVPQWFNEGLALMQDYRFAGPSDSIARYEGYARRRKVQARAFRDSVRLEDIGSIRGFFGGGSARVMLAYMTAGTEISGLLMEVGNAGLVSFLDSVRAGGEFAALYRDMRDRPGRWREAAVVRPAGYRLRGRGSAFPLSTPK